MTTNSTPMPENTLLDDFKPSRFLKVGDLLERWKTNQIVVQISRVTKESTIPNPKDLDPATADAKNPKGKPRVEIQPAFYFLQRDGSEWQSAYLLSAQIDIESIKIATRARKAGELIGKRVTIKVSQYRGNAVLRIDPQTPME